MFKITENKELTSREKAIQTNSLKEANMIKSQIIIMLKVLFITSLFTIIILGIIFKVV